MLLSIPELNIYSFVVDNTKIQLIGEVDDASSVSYSKRFYGYGKLEMYVPLTPKNLELCKVSNMLMVGNTGLYNYIITGIEPKRDENGFIKIKVTGRGLAHLLYSRMLYTTFDYKDVILSDVMYNMVELNFINLSEEYQRRVLPHFEIYENAYSEQIGPVVTLQRTGRSVKDRLDDLCVDYDVGYDVYYDIEKNKFIFKVLEHRDMTYDNGVNLPVIFDTETDDILDSTYDYNVESEKNMALVVGESQDSTESDVRIRAKVVVGDDTLSGYDRKELYIDARDLQSESENESGSIDEMSDEEYVEVLKDRGSKKLSENAIVQTFEVNIRYYGSQYQFDEQYTIGDKVTIIDRSIGVTVDAYISEVEHVFSDAYELRLTIGTGVPTLYSKIKAMLQD